MNATPSLSRIRIYPVKSLRGVDREIWELDQFGLRYDRRWMIVDPDGNFMTRRDHPEMARIELELGGDSIQLMAPQRTAVSFPLEPEPAAAEGVVIWGEKLAARPASEDASRWLSEFLRTPCRLVYMPEETVRPIEAEYTEGPRRTAFTDGFPLLLLSEESMAELNRRLPSPLGIERFRPNLVVKDVGEPHAEDTWRRIRLGHVEMRVVKPCSRCVITATHPETGDRGKEPLRTLATYRQRDGNVWFGQNVIHAGSDTIRVRDGIQVLESVDAPTFDHADQAAPPSDADADAAPTADADATPVIDADAEAAPPVDTNAEAAATDADAAADTDQDAAADALDDLADELAFALEEKPQPGTPAAPLELREAGVAEDVDLTVEPATPAAPPIELRFTQRPEPEQVLELYRVAGRNETTGDPDPGRIQRTLRASNVLASAWRGDELVAVLRAWTDGARDGFIADVVVHPDLAETEQAVELVRRTTEAHPGVVWVLRPGPGTDATGEALGWTALGEGWWMGGGG